MIILSEHFKNSVKNIRGDKYGQNYPDVTDPLVFLQLFLMEWRINFGEDEVTGSQFLHLVHPYPFTTSSVINEKVVKYRIDKQGERKYILTEKGKQIISAKCDE